MARLKLTDKTARSLKTTETQEDFFDSSFSDGCLALRVSKTGRKSWFTMYRAHGRLVRHTLGTYPSMGLRDARQEARNVLNKVAKGRNPHAEKREKTQLETFADLAYLYLDRHARRKKKSWQEDQRKIERELLPRWRHRRAQEITRRDVIQLVEGIVDRGSPISANRTLALISKIFAFAVDQGIVEANPAYRITRPAKETPRDRVLNELEIRAVWEALEGEHPVVAATYKFRLLTAQRGVEVLTMRWQDVHEGWWTIPAETSKNALPHRVPISHQAQQLLERVRPFTGGSEWAFESPKKPGAPMKSLTKTTRRVALAAQIEFTAHDLRRTAASCMASMGISRLTISKILNHVERGITAVYDRHTYDAEKRQALTLWADWVEATVSGEQHSRKVVRIG